MASCIFMIVLYGKVNKVESIYEIWISSKILTVNQIIKNNYEIYPILDIYYVSNSGSFKIHADADFGFCCDFGTFPKNPLRSLFWRKNLPSALGVEYKVLFEHVNSSALKTMIFQSTF